MFPHTPPVYCGVPAPLPTGHGLFYLDPVPLKTVCVLWVIFVSARNRLLPTEAASKRRPPRPTTPSAAILLTSANPWASPRPHGAGPGIAHSLASPRNGYFMGDSPVAHHSRCGNPPYFFFWVWSTVSLGLVALWWCRDR
ncbi:hypothetical protein NDU88_004286 [Pleurodeles waltl]|uniref:Uncharacterized protein n=1 Tax=Pleurodeles waltl TaxID=8319 RepID=A0AAV7M9N3_PLEWA|nr:hypothetical protein NDU88_004286 [Pleurodeles waltl]